MSDDRTFRRESVRASVGALARPRRVAFAAWCGERLLPNYRRFHAAERWGDPEALAGGLAHAWAVAGGARAERRVAARLVLACRRVTPNTGDFGSQLGSDALSAAVAVACALRCCLDGDARWPAVAIGMVVDTVDMSIDVPRDGLTHQEYNRVLEEHPATQAVLAELDGVRQRLAAAVFMTPELIEELRDSARAGGAGGASAP